MAEKVLINGHPALIGETSELKKESFLGLNIGDKINTIGRKTENDGYSSSCRIFNPGTPITYTGLYIDCDSTYMAFELSDSNIGIVTLLFVANVIPDNEPELILQNYKNQSILIFKAVFN